MNCPNCGAPLFDGARFCTGCGAKIVPPDRGPQFCTACGAARRPGAEFCTSCGRPFSAAAAPPAETGAAAQTAVPPETAGFADSPSEPPAAAAGSPIPATEEPLPAPEQGGEFACAARSFEEEAPAQRSSYPERLLQTLKQPRTLIPLAALLASWMGLSFAQGSDNAAVKLLSWLSFGRGGLGRGFPGDLGGMLGKAAVGTTLLGLCSGSLRGIGSGALSMLRQLKAVFTGKSGPAGILGAVLGLLLGAGAYMLFAGIKTASWESTMSGIAGAVLALSGLGRRFGGSAGQAASPSDGSGFLPALLAGAVPGFTLCAALLSIV